MTDSVLTLIAGPTASGKSRFGMELAEKNGGTVICADSLQLYESLPILTAQPTDADKNQIPHALFGVLKASDSNSLGKWLQMVTPLLKSIKNPILVGGTGMYLSAITNGIAKMPDISEKNRKLARMMAPEEIKKALPGFKFTDPQRLRRAFEILLETGKRIEEFQNAPLEKVYKGKIRKILIDPTKEVLNERIRQRLDQMMENGVLEEVKSFHGKSIAIGLSEIRSFQKNEISKEEMLFKVAAKSRQYAKRQRTWFRHKMSFDEVLRSF